MLENPLRGGFWADAGNPRKIIRGVPSQCEELGDSICGNAPFGFHFAWAEQGKALGLRLVNFATLSNEDHEIFIVGGNDTGFGIGCVNITRNDVIRLLLLDGENGPTQSGGYVMQKRELALESFGSFFSVGFVGGMEGHAFGGDSTVKNHRSLGGVKILHNSQKGGGEAVRCVGGFPLRVSQGSDGVKAAIGVVVAVDKNHAHFFSALVSGAGLELGFGLATTSGGWRRHSIRGPFVVSILRRR